MATVFEEFVTILGFEVDEGGMEEYEELIEKTGASLKKWALAGWAAVAAGGAVVTMTAQNIDAAFKLSQRQGTNFEDQQRFIHAAELTGASSESMTTALGKLNTMAAEAKFGEVSAALQFLGLELGEAGKGAKTGSELFLALSDHVASLETAGERADLVSRLGLSPDLVELMGEGSERIQELALGLDALGGTVTTEAAKRAVKLAENIVKVGAAAEGAWRLLSGKFEPVLIRITDRMIEWVEANQELIDSGIGEFAENLAEALRPVSIFLGLMGLAAIALAASILGIPALLVVEVTALLALLTFFIESVIRKADVLKAKLLSPIETLKELGRNAAEFLGLGGDGSPPAPTESVPFFGFGESRVNILGIVPGGTGGAGPQASVTLNQTNEFQISAPDAAAAAEAVARRMEDVAREAAATLATPIVA